MYVHTLGLAAMAAAAAAAAPASANSSTSQMFTPAMQAMMFQQMMLAQQLHFQGGMFQTNQSLPHLAQPSPSYASASGGAGGDALGAAKGEESASEKGPEKVAANMMEVDPKTPMQHATTAAAAAGGAAGQNATNASAPAPVAASGAIAFPNVTAAAAAGVDAQSGDAGTSSAGSMGEGAGKGSGQEEMVGADGATGKVQAEQHPTTAKVGAAVTGKVVTHHTDGALTVSTIIGGKVFKGAIREVRGAGSFDASRGGPVPVRTQPSVVIIGAGFSGLAAADEMHALGCKVVVLEARDRIGGRCWTDDSLGGRVVDLGAGWIHGITGNPIAELARRESVALCHIDSDLLMHDDAGKPVSMDNDIKIEAMFNDMLQQVKSEIAGRGNKTDQVSWIIRARGSKAQRAEVERQGTGMVHGSLGALRLTAVRPLSADLISTDLIWVSEMRPVLIPRALLHLLHYTDMYHFS